MNLAELQQLAELLDKLKQQPGLHRFEIRSADDLVNVVNDLILEKKLEQEKPK